MDMNKNTIGRFWQKVHISVGCWEWQNSKRNKGYGAFVWRNDDGEVVQGSAHRFAYELLVGPIPTGMCVLHRCDNPACVRPDHLFLGTIADNNRDMCEKGRHVPGGTYRSGAYKRGVQHHAAKLNPELVREIRAEYRKGGKSLRQLGVQYRVGQTAIWKVVKRQLWRDVS